MTFRRARLQAQITGKAKEVSPARARQLSIMAAARREAAARAKVTRLKKSLTKLQRELKEARKDATAAKRELELLTAPHDMDLG